MPKLSVSLPSASALLGASPAEAAAAGLDLLLLSRAQPEKAAAVCRAMIEEARRAGGAGSSEKADSPESLAQLSALLVRFARLSGLGSGVFEAAEAEAAAALVAGVKRVRAAGKASLARLLLGKGALDALADAALLDKPADPREALSALSRSLGLCALDAPAEALRGRPVEKRARARLCAWAAAEEAKRALARAAKAAEAQQGGEGRGARESGGAAQAVESAESALEVALAPLVQAADALSTRLLAAAANRVGDAAHSPGASHSLDALAALSEADAILDAALYAPVVEAMPPAAPGRRLGALPLLHALGRLLDASKPLRELSARFLNERARHAWLVAKAGADALEPEAPGWRGALRLVLEAHRALEAEAGREAGGEREDEAAGGAIRLPADDESPAMEIVRIFRLAADVLAKAPALEARAAGGDPEGPGPFAEAAAAGGLAALEWAALQKSARSLRRLWLERGARRRLSPEEAEAMLRRLAAIGGEGALPPGLDEIEALSKRGGEALAALSPWAAFAACEAAESAFDEGCAASRAGPLALAREAGPALMRLRETALSFLALPQAEAAFGGAPHYWMRRAALDGALALPADRRPASVYDSKRAAGDEAPEADEAGGAEAERRAEAKTVFGFARRAAEASKGLRLEDGLPQAAADCLLSCGAALASDALRRFAVRMSEERRDQDEWDFFIRAASGRPYPPPYAGQVRAAADAAAKPLAEAQAAPAAAAGRRAVEAWLSSAAGTAMVYCAAGDAPDAALWAEKALAVYGALAGGPASFEAELAMGDAMTALHRYREAFSHFAAAWRIAGRGRPEAELAAFRAYCCRQAADYAEWRGGWSRRLAALAPEWTAPFGRAERILGRLDAFPVVEAVPQSGADGAGRSVRWLVTAGASSAADAFSAMRTRYGGGPSLRCEYAMPLEAAPAGAADEAGGALELPPWAAETAAPNARLGAVLLPEADWFGRLGGRAAAPESEAGGAPEAAALSSSAGSSRSSGSSGRFGPEGFDPVLLAHAFALGSPGDPGLWAKAFAKEPGAAWALEALHLAADVLSTESVEAPSARQAEAEGEAAASSAPADRCELALEAAASAPQLLSVPQPDGRPAKLFGPQGGARFSALLAVPAGLLKEELRAAGLSAPRALMTAADPRLPFLLAKLSEEGALDGQGLEAWLEGELARLPQGAEAASGGRGEDEDAGEEAPPPDGSALRPAAVKIVIPLYAEEADFVRLFDAEAFLQRAREAAAPLLPVRAGRPNLCEGEDRRSVLRPSDVREVIPPPLGDSWCAITESVLREGMIHAGIRFDLLPGEGMGSPDGRRDSGWFFMTKSDLERLCGRPSDAPEQADGFGTVEGVSTAALPAAWPQIYGGALNVPATLEPGLRFAAELPPGTVILREESGEFRAVDPADVFPEGFVFTMGNGDWYDPRTGRREKPFGPAAETGARRSEGDGGGSSSGFSGPSGFDGPGFVGNA